MNMWKPKSPRHGAKKVVVGAIFFIGSAMERLKSTLFSLTFMERKQIPHTKTTPRILNSTLIKTQSTKTIRVVDPHSLGPPANTGGKEGGQINGS
jgi:hypothetical protein